MSKYRVWSIDNKYAFGKPGSDGTMAKYDIEVSTNDERTIFDMLSRAVASMRVGETSIVVETELSGVSRSTTAFFYRIGDTVEFLDGSVMAALTKYSE